MNMNGTTYFALEPSARRKRGANRDVQSGTSREHRNLQRSNVPRAGGATGSASGQASGAKCVVGVDEVGRGSWAGPLLVVAARQTARLPKGLSDSKLMSKKQREQILNKLSNCCKFGEGWVKASEIDIHGLAAALKLGVSRALRQLKVDIGEQIIMDGKISYIPQKYKNGRSVIGADNKLPIVSAASIYAKVTRDQFMKKLSVKYPQYGFGKHVGYGTNFHKLALEKFGVLEEVHRLSFKPIKNLPGATE